MTVVQVNTIHCQHGTAYRTLMQMHIDNIYIYTIYIYIYIIYILFYICIYIYIIKGSLGEKLPCYGLLESQRKS